MPRSELAQRIYLQLEQMGPKERQLAEFLLTHEAELAIYSSADMARLARVSKPVVSRFFKRLGYDSFAEVRQDLRKVQTSGSPLLADQQSSDIGTLLANHQAQEARNWQQTLTDLQRLPLDAIADTICAARQIKVIGFRNSYPVALHWRQQLLQLRTGVDVVPQPGQTLAEELSQLNEQDLVIMVAMRRRPVNVKRIMQWLGKSPAKCLLITDPSGLEHATHADWTLTCHQISPGGFASYASAMAVVSLMSNLCQQKLSDDSRVQAIDDLFDLMDELEPSLGG